MRTAAANTAKTELSLCSIRMANTLRSVLWLTSRSGRFTLGGNPSIPTEYDAGLASEPTLRLIHGAAHLNREHTHTYRLLDLLCTYLTIFIH